MPHGIWKDKVKLLSPDLYIIIYCILINANTKYLRQRGTTCRPSFLQNDMKPIEVKQKNNICQT